jgi:hypothetical protein
MEDRQIAIFPSFGLLTASKGEELEENVLQISALNVVTNWANVEDLQQVISGSFRQQLLKQSRSTSLLFVTVTTFPCSVCCIMLPKSILSVESCTLGKTIKAYAGSKAVYGEFTNGKAMLPSTNWLLESFLKSVRKVTSNSIASPGSSVN